MNYEKKYNEALKRAKAAIDVAADRDLVKGVASTIFPELRESEDEWIRKHIIKILDRLAPCHWDGNEKARCIAYLEKQKIPKGSPTPDLTTMLVPNRYNEHQPAEWSEEDKEMLNRCIANAKVVVPIPDKNGGLKSFETREDKELVDWLKSLPERFSLQPKQEWSEEDEDKVDDICKLIEHATIIPRSGDDDTGTPPTRLNDKYKGELKAFVKSLRPQPHWRPSGAQMQALWDAYKGGKEQEPLRELIEQLKNLI